MELNCLLLFIVEYFSLYCLENFMIKFWSKPSFSQNPCDSNDSADPLVVIILPKLVFLKASNNSNDRLTFCNVGSVDGLVKTFCKTSSAL